MAQPRKPRPGEVESKIKPPSNKWKIISLIIVFLGMTIACILSFTEFKLNADICGAIGILALLWFLVECFYFSPKRWKGYRAKRREYENQRYKEFMKYKQEAPFNRKPRFVVPVKHWTTEDLKDPTKVDTLPRGLVKID